MCCTLVVFLSKTIISFVTTHKFCCNDFRYALILINHGKRKIIFLAECNATFDFLGRISWVLITIVNYKFYLNQILNYE